MGKRNKQWMALSMFMYVMPVNLTKKVNCNKIFN